MKVTVPRLFGFFYAAIIAVVIIAAVWDAYTFRRLTPSQHLLAAKQALQGTNTDVDVGLRHISAIPPGSPEAVEAKEIGTQLSWRKAAIEQAVEDAKQAKEARHAAVAQLRVDLKALGYDLTVTESEVPDEIVITSSEFADTDHRVRFLSFLRGKKSPVIAACWAGWRNVRLKSSGFFGFDQSYSLNCFDE